MQRRGGHRQNVKGRRTAKVKTRKTPAANASQRLERLTRERDEALDQQAATAEVLSVISSSPGQLETVFQAILANATRLCGANFGTLYLRDGNSFRAAAFHNAPPAFIEARKGTGLGLSISHDIIVKQHGGSIEIDTEPGQFTEIRVILPRVLASLPER